MPDMINYALSDPGGGMPYQSLGSQLGGIVGGALTGWEQGTDAHQHAKALADQIKQQEQETQQKATTFSQSQAAKSLAALQEQAKEAYKVGAKTGDEATLKRAGDLIPAIGQAYNTAYGTNLPVLSAPTGSAVGGSPAVPAKPSELLTPSGPTPDGSPLGAYSTMPIGAVPAVAPHNTLNNDKTKAYLRSGMMLSPTPSHGSPGETFFSMDPLTDGPETGSVWTVPDHKGEAAAAAKIVGLQQQLTIAQLLEAGRDKRSDSNNGTKIYLGNQTNATNQGRIGAYEDRTNALYPVDADGNPITNGPKAQAALAKRQDSKFKAGQAAASKAMAIAARSGGGTNKLTGKGKPGTEEQIQQAGADAMKKAYDEFENTHPLVSASGAGPTSYTDTSLLPEVEKTVRQGLAAFPGMQVTSRARSPERNAQAGGAPDSSHKHRVGFDVVPPAGKDAAVRQFYEARGARVLGPGDPGGEPGHLHIDYRNLIPGHGVNPPAPAAKPDAAERLLSLAHPKKGPK